MKNDNSAEMEPDPLNPFNYLDPTDSKGFIGRWPMVHEMANELTSGRNSYACIGGRRFGKTSLLGVLHQELRQPSAGSRRRPVLSMKIDVMGYSFTSVGNFWAALLQELFRRVDDRLPNIPDDSSPWRVALAGLPLDEVLSGNSPTITPKKFAEAVNRTLDLIHGSGGPRRLVVLLDEVDSLLDYPWHRELFAQLRASLNSGELSTSLRVVLAGSRRFLDEATNRGSPLLNALKHQFLTSLDETNIYELAARSAGFPESVRRAVWQQSGGHPFLAQYLLYYLWGFGSTDTTEIDVTRLAQQFVQEETGHLEAWAKAIGLDGLQIYGLFLTTSDWMDVNTLRKMTRNNQPGAIKVDLNRALTALRYHGLIMWDARSIRYRRGGDLFRDWYIEEISRLSEELRPATSSPPTDPPFWIQLVTHGPLQAAVGHHIAIAAGGAPAEVHDTVTPDRRFAEFGLLESYRRNEMDPITTAVIAALAAGVAKSAGQIGEKVIVDAYNGLKEVLKRRFGEKSRVVEAVQDVEDNPQDPAYQKVLDDQVKKSKAGDYEDVKQAAQALLDKVKAQPGGEQIVQSAIGNYIAQASGGSTASVNVGQREDPKR